jgi:pimeloyl-ACP methyl ester carboxylesterase
MSECLDLACGPIHWKDYGGSGQPIVMVHGLGGSIANWDVLGPRLTPLGRVVALDLPGFGLSPPGKDWSLETHAAAIVDLVEYLGGPAVLLGNSLGALLCEKVAAERPELVSALILISPATPPRLPDPHIHWPTARRLMLNSTPLLGPALSRRMLSTMTPRELINDSLARITHKPGRVPLDLVESFVVLAEQRSHFPWAADAVPKTGQSIRALFLRRSAFTAMIRDIVAPTLVIHGVADPIISRTAIERLCWMRPDWTLVQMEDTGHTPQIDAPIRTLSVVEPWLHSHLSQTRTPT